MGERITIIMEGRGEEGKEREKEGGERRGREVEGEQKGKQGFVDSQVFFEMCNSALAI